MLVGNTAADEVKSVLDQLRKQAREVRVLGCYPQLGSMPESVARIPVGRADGSTTTRVVGRDQTCADARAGALALRSTLENGPPPEAIHDVESVTIAADGASANARYVQRFVLPGRLEILVRGTDTVIREDGRLVVVRSVGQETIRNP